MAAPAHIRCLYDTLEALPEGMVGEIIDGQLHTQPRPSGRHADVALELGGNLKGPFDRGRGGPGGWWILAEPEVHFIRDQEVLVPDLAGWRRTRMPHLPSDQRFLVVPDWVCEVLSPSTASRDIQIKLPVYARYGVGHAWIVDPAARRLTVYAQRDGDWETLATFGEHDAIAAPPFAEVCLHPPWP